MILIKFIWLETSFSQFVNTGTDRSSIKWNKIETLHYIVIYPRNYEQEAITYALKLEKAHKPVFYSIGFEPKKTRYILRTHSATSNGMTAVAPNRVVSWTKPHQDSYGQSWDEQLILHEGRHVAQFGSMYRGASKLPIWLTGQMGYSYPIGLYVPSWFMEGDAVVTETALSHFGRGRQPGFEKGMRAYFLQRGNPGYDKMMLGSYRDFIPNHYETGYQVVAANRVFRDSNIFKDKLENIARYPWYFYPFSKKSNGLKDTRRFKYYRYAADTLFKLWEKQDFEINSDDPELLFESKDYSGLTYLKGHGANLYAYMSNYDNVPQIVELKKDGSYRSLISLGYRSGRYFDVNDTLLAFTLEMPNIRWEQESNLSLFVMDMKTGFYRRLTYQKNYYSPALHPKAGKIAAVEMDNENRCQIAIINISDGKIIERIENPDNNYIITPQWTSDGTALIYIKITEKGKVLCLNDFNTEKVLFGPSQMDFKHPVVRGHKVYISGDWSGIENIYRVSIWGGEPVKVTNSRFGAIAPVILKDTLTYLDYTWKGNRVVQQSKDEFIEVPFLDVENNAPKLYEELAEMEKGVVDFSALDTVDYKISRYRKFKNQFNFHSWIPAASVPLGGNIYIPGITLFSQNLLNDATLALGFNYLSESYDEQFFINYIYSGLFPVINFNMYYGTWNRELKLSEETRPVSAEIKGLRFETKIELPLLWRQLGSYLTLTPYLYGSFAQDAYNYDLGSFTDISADDLKSRGYRTYAGIGILHSWKQQKAYRDLNTTWGYSLKLVYQYFNHSIYNYKQNFKGAEVDFYLPGFSQNDNIQLSFSYLNLSDKLSPFSMVYTQPVTMPTGWHNVDGLYSNNNIRIGGEYNLPFAYPDAEIFWLAYLKRFNLSIWADYGLFEKDAYKRFESRWNTYHIVGGAAWADLNLFRYPIDLKVGLKAGYSFSHKEPYINIILNMGSIL